MKQDPEAKVSISKLRTDLVLACLSGFYFVRSFSGKGKALYW